MLRDDPIKVMFGHSLLNITRLFPGVQVGNTRGCCDLLMFGNSSRDFPTKLNAMQVKEQSANTSVYVFLIAGIQRKCVYSCPRSAPGSMALFLAATHYY